MVVRNYFCSQTFRGGDLGGNHEGRKCKNKWTRKQEEPLSFYCLKFRANFRINLSSHPHQHPNKTLIHAVEIATCQIYFHCFCSRMNLSLFLSNYELCLFHYLYSSNCPLLKVCHWMMPKYIIKHFGNDSCRAKISFFICLISITLFNFPRSLPLACVTILLGPWKLANNSEIKTCGCCQITPFSPSHVVDCYILRHENI